MPKEDYNMVFEEVYDKESSKRNNYHYLAFDRQLFGFSTLGSYSKNYPEILKKNDEIIKKLIEKREVCSLYPAANLTLFPILNCKNGHYDIDIANINKHFADILKINDEILKTKYMFVDFGHGADNFSYSKIKSYLEDLLNKSKILETIYIEDIQSAK